MTDSSDYNDYLDMTINDLREDIYSLQTDIRELQNKVFRDKETPPTEQS